MAQSNLRRRNNSEILHVVNRMIVVLIWAAILAFMLFTFYPEWKKRNDMALSLERQREELAAEELHKKKLEREVHLLQDDPVYVETIARDKLDMMKDGETIFRLDPPKQAGAAPVKSP